MNRISIILSRTENGICDSLHSIRHLNISAENKKGKKHTKKKEKKKKENSKKQTNKQTKTKQNKTNINNNQSLVHNSKYWNQIHQTITWFKTNKQTNKLSLKFHSGCDYPFFFHTFFSINSSSGIQTYVRPIEHWRTTQFSGMSIVVYENTVSESLPSTCLDILVHSDKHF